MTNTRTRTGRFTTIISWGIYVLVALISAALPIGYSVMQSEYLSGQVLSDADFQATLLRQHLIASRVNRTAYAPGLAELLVRPDDMRKDAPQQIRKLLDSNNNEIASTQAVPLPFPVVKGSSLVTLDDGTVVGRVEVSRSGQSIVITTLVIALFSLLLGAGLIFSIHISPLRSLREAENELSRMARFDFLTGLLNREYALSRTEAMLAEAWEAGRYMALFFIDLDQFKMVNDSRGHHVGDAVLKEAALRINAQATEGMLVARLGGDEFFLACEFSDEEMASYGQLSSACPSSDPENSASHRAAAAIANNVLTALRQPIKVHGETFYLTGSIGIALCPQHGSNSVELIERADAAMYSAKCNHRDKYRFFEDNMVGISEARLSLQSDLRKAIDNDEYRLVYQPLVRLEDMKIMGVEALLRWERKSGMAMSPAEFVPVLEESGLITLVGEWVLREACQQVAKLRESEPDFYIAVNISVRQFIEDNFESIVERALLDFNIPGSAIELELTESLLIDRSDIFIEKMHRLKKLGLRVAMDDFGTGYSSLSRLKSIPVDVLKIDRSFVSGVGDNIADSGIVDAIMALAHGLGLKVVAEGIETAQQRDALQKSNCDYGQGYLLDRPMSAKSIEEKLSLVHDRVRQNESGPDAQNRMTGTNEGAVVWSS